MSEFPISAQDAEGLLSALAKMDLTVPPRGRGRTKSHTERWMICHLIATLVDTANLTCPLRVRHGDKPDFVIELPNGRIGIEATEAVGKQFAHYQAIATREFPGALLEPALFRWGSPKVSDDQIRAILRQGRQTASGWMGDDGESEWATAINDCLRAKLDALSRADFKRYKRNWLVIYDNLPLPQINLHLAIEKFRPLVTDMWTRDPTFDAVYVEVGKEIAKVTANAVKVLPLNNLWPKSNVI